jgi:hypothetical protein
MKSRKFAISTIILTGWVGLTIGAGILSSQGQSTRTPTPDEVAKEHGRIFSINPGVIQAALSKVTGDIYVHGGFLFTESTTALPKRMTKSEYEAYMTTILLCSHSLVVLGRIGTGTSRLTNDSGFLYTDWEFQVEEIIRNNPEAPVKAGSAIIVVKDGGKLQVQGRMVYAIDDQFADFRPGGEYLLFLDYIPKTGAYVAYRPMGFAFSGGVPTPLSIRRISETPALDVMNKESLLNAVRAAQKTILEHPADYIACKGQIH